MINIDSIITENTNLIEIYLCSKQDFNNKDINIKISEENLNKIKDHFKITREVKFISYYYNNINYNYDTSNDSQILNIKKIENDVFYNTNKLNFYYISYCENKLPNHYFPCINNINNKEIYNITEFKINNRITLIISNNNCYIQYRYNKNVETEKTQGLINNIIKKIISII